MHSEIIPNRVIIEITGVDSANFLQGLISNDIKQAENKLVYTALLSPKGKYLFDFFITSYRSGFLLDVLALDAAKLIQRLNMYKLRADVTLAETNMAVGRGVGLAPQGSFSDPRHHALGWRIYGPEQTEISTVNWDSIRVEYCVPETGIELISDETYILEAGFERMSGVDFRKGCYVGQEITARMKHKTELRKGLVTVNILGSAPISTDILSNGKIAGKLFTQSGEKAIAYLRFDRVSDHMTAGTAKVKYCEPV